MNTSFSQASKPACYASHQVQFLVQRVHRLYRAGHEVAQNNTVLRTAFEELSNVIDLLQKAEQEFQQHREAWLNERAELEAEIQRYQDFFMAAPLPYIVTSLDGTIRQANIAATELLGAPEKLLVGRALALFTPEGQRRTFRSQISELQQCAETQQLEIEVQPWEGAVFPAELHVLVMRSRDGKPQHLRWQIRDISACKHTEQQLLNRIEELEQKCSATA